MPSWQRWHLLEATRFSHLFCRSCCQACRHCASVLGLRLGAEAASDIAELAASASQVGWED